MDENTKKQLNEFLLKLINGAEKAGDFAIEQAPLVAQEVVAYGQATSTAIVVIFVILVLACFRYVPRGIAKLDDSDDATLATHLPVVIGLPFVTLMFAMFASNHFDDFFKSWFAPRLYLIEYIRDAIK